MGQSHQPRMGSMQVWPRKRARRIYPRVRTWAASNEKVMQGFVGFKVGMGHAMVAEQRKGRKGAITVNYPITIVECPPIKLVGIRAYQETPYGIKAIGEQWALAKDIPKELWRRVPERKKHESKLPEQATVYRAIICTQPKLTSVNKKIAELMEVGIGGKPEDQKSFLLDKLGKELPIQDVVKDGQFIDIHAVSRGHGFQGPVRRFGVSLRSHKSEKAVRNPGSLGAWNAQSHMMYRVAHAGQTGMHTRTEYNKQVIKVEQDWTKLNPNGGFRHYGLIKNPCIIVRGSVAGSSRRMIRFTQPIRLKSQSTQPPSIQSIIFEGGQ